MFRLPALDQRVTINGRTGSGKTVFGAWLLSEAEFDKQPFVIVDFKNEKLFNAVDRIRDLDFNEMPKHPGVYKLHVEEGEDDRLNGFLSALWRRGKIGVFIDEGHLMPEDELPYRKLLVTGRSRGIPVYTLTQRPVWVSRYAFSEADYYSLFSLHDKRDRDTVRNFTPDDHPEWKTETRLPPYHSRWYDAGADYSAIMKPAPHPDKIVARFNARLKPKQKWV
jgi:hypothetical protein